MVAAALALAGFGEMCWDVITVSVRQRIGRTIRSGGSNAGYRLVGYGAMPIGAALGGFLGQTLGLRWVFGIGAVVCVALLACMSLVTRRAMDAAEPTRWAAGPHVHMFGT